MESLILISFIWLIIMSAAVLLLRQENITLQKQIDKLMEIILMLDSEIENLK